MHFSSTILYTIGAEERWRRGEVSVKALFLSGWYG